MLNRTTTRDGGRRGASRRDRPDLQTVPSQDLVEDLPRQHGFRLGEDFQGRLDDLGAEHDVEAGGPEFEEDVAEEPAGVLDPAGAGRQPGRGQVSIAGANFIVGILHADSDAVPLAVFHRIGRVVANAVLAAEFRSNRVEHRVQFLAECGLGKSPMPCRRSLRRTGPAPSYRRW